MFEFQIFKRKSQPSPDFIPKNIQKIRIFTQPQSIALNGQLSRAIIIIYP